MTIPSPVLSFQLVFLIERRKGSKSREVNVRCVFTSFAVVLGALTGTWRDLLNYGGKTGGACARAS